MGPRSARRAIQTPNFLSRYLEIQTSKILAEAQLYLDNEILGFRQKKIFYPKKNPNAQIVQPKAGRFQTIFPFPSTEDSSKAQKATLGPPRGIDRARTTAINLKAQRAS